MRPDDCTSVEREVVRAPPDALGGHRAGHKARHGLRGQRRAVDRARVPFAGGRALPKAMRRAARGGTVRKCTGALGGRLTGQHAACCEYVTQRAWRTPRHRASRRARPRGAARAWRGAGGRWPAKWLAQRGPRPQLPRWEHAARRVVGVLGGPTRRVKRPPAAAGRGCARRGRRRRRAVPLTPCTSGFLEHTPARRAGSGAAPLTVRQGALV